MLRQRPGEHVADMVAPEVLVLDVDQPSGASHRLAVAAGHAALAAAGERVVPVEPQVGIGPQQLDQVRASRHRRRGRRLLGQRVRVEVHPREPVLDPPQRAAAQRCGVEPPLAEDRLDVVDGRTADRRLDVVPRRVRAVLLRQGLRLRVPVVLGVVATRVAQVDPADVRDVARRVVTVPDHHHLLVVGPAEPHAHVQQRLGTAPLQVATQAAVLLGGEAECLLVRAPHQPADVHPSFVGAAQHLGHLAAGLAGQPLVGVALPVGEQHQVTGARRLQPLVQLGEVRRAVDQRPDQVAGGPGLGPRDAGRRGWCWGCRARLRSTTTRADRSPLPLCRTARRLRASGAGRASG